MHLGICCSHLFPECFLYCIENDEHNSQIRSLQFKIKASLWENAEQTKLKSELNFTLQWRRCTFLCCRIGDEGVVSIIKLPNFVRALFVVLVSQFSVGDLYCLLRFKHSYIFPDFQGMEQWSNWELSLSLVVGIFNVNPSFLSYISILDYEAVFLALRPTCSHIHPSVIDYIYSALLYSQYRPSSA